MEMLERRQVRSQREQIEDTDRKEAVKEKEREGDKEREREREREKET